jgi:hypothetical protein
MTNFMHSIKLVGIATAFCLLLTIGCSTTQNLNTSSGRPEITIPNTEKSAIVAVLSDHYANDGFSIFQVDDYKAEYRREGSLMQNALMGSRYNPSTQISIVFNFVAHEEDIRVLAACFCISNPGSAFEKRMDMTEGHAAHLQSTLEVLNERILLASGADPQEISVMRRKEYVARRQKLDPLTKSAILEGEVLYGMDKYEVFASWGIPDEVEKVKIDKARQKLTYGKGIVFMSSKKVLWVESKPSE